MELLAELERAAEWLDQWHKLPDFGSNKREPDAEAETEVYAAMAELGYDIKHGIEKVREAVGNAPDKLPEYGRYYW